MSIDFDSAKQFHHLPKHIAIIMDGNGRWAKQKGLIRTAGHEQGGKRAREIIESCARKQISTLTLFAFGQENWQRPAEEVNFLMKLLLQSLQNEIAALKENNIQLKFIGDRQGFNSTLQQQMDASEEATKNNHGLLLIIAVNYSGQWDITTACQKISAQIKDGLITPAQIDSQLFQRHLSTVDIPPPDLFVRTSGEQRLSNFLLWQLAYTELYFTDVLWPDFDEYELEKALAFYAGRERRYGMISEQVVKEQY